MTETPISVCVVEDDDAVRDSLRILLDSHGMVVRAFDAPVGFLSIAAELKSDCLIFDLHMPEMTGLQLAEKLRAMRIETPIIIVSGRADANLGRRMERAGVFAVLAKPVSDEDIVRTIRQACSAPTSRAGRRSDA